MDNVVINTTGATSATAQGLVAYRTQEMDLESLYFLGNSNQTGMTLDGTGNYTGGTFLDNQFSGFGTAVNAIGHQVTNPATTDWMNASTFVRLHIDCPTSGGNPISGTYGINLQQGDGNTFTGGDVEGCSTALHLGPNAQNNTIVGLRNENSTSQVVADAGSAYNNWMTGGTMFTGKLTDNGTRNSFLDTFHRSFNALNGDWYMSQQDATLTNHFRLGTGAGNERGLLNEIQTDYGYRWLYGFSDATGGPAALPDAGPAEQRIPAADPAVELRAEQHKQPDGIERGRHGQCVLQLLNEFRDRRRDLCQRRRDTGGCRRRWTKRETRSLWGICWWAEQRSRREPCHCATARMRKWIITYGRDLQRARRDRSLTRTGTGTANGTW